MADIVYLENAWSSKQMITEGEAAIPLESTLYAFRNQEETKQISTIVLCISSLNFRICSMKRSFQNYERLRRYIQSPITLK